MTITSSYDRPHHSVAEDRCPVAPAQTSHVLVVEDDEDMRFLLRTLLERRGGINVVEAVNGKMAVALAENVRLDLVLMDGSLPVLDGFDATRHIRRLAFACDVPIVFLSGHALPADAAKAFAAGCDDYLVKPFGFGEWDRVLKRHLPQSAAK